MMYMSRFYSGIFLPGPVMELLVRVCWTGQKKHKIPWGVLVEDQREAQ